VGCWLGGSCVWLRGCFVCCVVSLFIVCLGVWFLVVWVVGLVMLRLCVLLSAAFWGNEHCGVVLIAVVGFTFG